ncbi:MAG TPA: PDDEXK nuclease domain-containing protein [Puia sp.]|nr:PDDEXK nuclease domain-containing protein [Puia sp.]
MAKEVHNTNKNNLERLVNVIQEANRFFLDQVQKQVNTSLTLRNWIVGYYIVEYEQNGQDRAEYGEQLFQKLAERLKRAGIKGLSFTTLHLCKQFYEAYPQILQSLPEEFQIADIQRNRIVPSLTEQSEYIENTSTHLLLSRLSFTHFVELIKADTSLKRLFYEVEAISNNWSVRELQRAMNSMLFERTGLSKDKQSVLEKHRNGTGLKPEDIFRNPYMLDFLGLEEKTAYVETDLEQAIINHLQTFLLELGKGFCFEARQKRITFDNTHYRIDLVFYHRILKCNILIDLKLSQFTHADAGQMNVYLNYYKENETYEGDNPPVGIILCAGKNETLVRYATSGLAHHVFVSKYMTNLPSEAELAKIIKEEQEKLIE